MATYDSETGTGGLDASIQFLDELSRPEVRIFWGQNFVVFNGNS
jgi:hypothetical protein